MGGKLIIWVLLHALIRVLCSSTSSRRHPKGLRRGSVCGSLGPCISHHRLMAATALLAKSNGFSFNVIDSLLARKQQCCLPRCSSVSQRQYACHSEPGLSRFLERVTGSEFLTLCQNFPQRQERERSKTVDVGLPFSCVANQLHQQHC
jgi:hypothetical protein